MNRDQSGARPAAALLALLAGLGSASQALAQQDAQASPEGQPAAEAPAAAAPRGPSPWYVGARESALHQSNVFSSPDGVAPVADTSYTTTVGAGVNAIVSRQRFFADLSANHTQYQRTSILNNDGYDARAGVDWETLNRLSGTVRLGSSRALSQLNPGAAPVLTSTRNLQRTDTLDLTGVLGGVTDLSFDASYGHRNVSYSAPEYDSQRFRQDLATLGARYRVSGALTLSGGAAGDRAVFPHYAPDGSGGFVADNSRTRGAYVRADWVPTGISSVAARLNFTRTTYDLNTALDYSGVTGFVNWDWKPTGKLSFATNLSRDTGRGAGVVQSTPVRTGSTLATGSTASSDFSRITDSLTVRVSYEVTAKIGLDLNTGVARRDLADANNAANDGTDETHTYGLGARWAPLRWASLGCTLSHETRSANTPLSNDYSARSYGCFAQVTLQ